ncbi:MAG: hypothetical protein ACK5Z5_09545 [Neisseriaceae bacterium]
MKFDPVNYIQEARKHGFTQEQSEFNAQQLEIIIEQHAQIIEKKSLESENRFEKSLLLRNLATKLDLKETNSSLQKEIHETKTELQKEIHDTKTGLRKEIHDTKTELRKEIHDTKVELKNDIKILDVKIEQYRYNTFKLILWTGVGITATLLSTLGSMLAKGFHWW